MSKRLSVISLLRRSALAGAAVLALVIGTLGISAPAFATGDPTISGTVTDVNGAVDEAQVSVYTDGEGLVDSEASGVDGLYTLTVPSGANYKLLFQAAGHDDTWYSSASDFDSATPVAVDVADVPDIDQELAITPTGPDCSSDENAGVIGGTVLNGATAPNTTATITIHDENLGTDVTAAQDGSGVFSQDCLDIYDEFEVTITDSNYATQTFETDFSEDNTVDLGDIHLVPGATISGTVTNAITNAKVEDAEVVILNSSTDSQIADVETDVNGAYSVPHVPDVNIVVHFFSHDSNLANQWYDNASTRSAAKVFKTAVDKTVDAHLAKAGTITGHVQGNTGSGVVPQENIDVILYTTAGDEVDATSTDSSGEYDFSRIPAGSYKIEAQDQSDALLDQWYLAKGRLGAATVVALTTTSAAVLSTMTLTPAASISGTVTVDDDPSTVYVEVENLNGDEVAETNAQSDGSYTIGGLTAGSYLVQFASNDDGFASNYYPNSVTEQGATVVTVTAGQKATGKDAHVEREGSISGSLTDGTDALFGNVDVYTTNGEYVTSGIANSFNDGDFTVDSLPAGNYLVDFTAAGYKTQYWSSKSTLATATPVTVTANTDTPLGAVVLTPGASTGGTASISGTVKDSKGHALEGAEVIAFLKGVQYGGDAGETQTDAQGKYTIAGLSAGSYTIQFSDQGPAPHDYVTQYWKNVKSDEKATYFKVAKGAHVTGKNATLLVGATITGTITDPSNSGDYFEIDLYTTKGKLVNEDYEQNSYTFSGVAAGSYRIRVNPEDGDNPYAPTWYGGKTTFSSASTVTVKSGTATTRNVTLVTATGAISGVVTSSGDKLPIDGTNVFVFEKLPNGTYSYFGSANSDGTGAYKVSKLPAGSYKVEYSSASGYSTKDKFYSKGTSLKTATVVKVKAAATTKLKAVALTPAGLLQLTVPIITGSATVGSPLAVSSHLTLPSSGVKKSYVWWRDDTVIKGATKSSYKVTSKDVGHTLWVEVTASGTGLATVYRQSAPVLVK